MSDLDATRRWLRVDALFAEALALAPAERVRFLADVCGDDLELRHEIEDLLVDSSAAEDLFQLAEVQPDALAGRVIDAFRVLEEIGHGGMGAVFLAERADGQFRQRVALKLLRGGFFDQHAERRFRLERQILARLEHPNIARLLGGGVTAEGQPYFVMEYVAGVPITEYCDRHRLGIEQRLALFRTVCAAVQYAHQNLVVHRDLKPGNILVTEDGQVKLLDFGIARVLEPEAFDQSVAMTHTGALLMTPDYAAPEQVRGEAITTATDVYALGMLLFELLTGRRPYAFTGRRLADIQRAVCEQAPPRPSTVVASAGESVGSRLERSQARRLGAEPLRRRLSGDLDNIVLLALRKEPERRYRSVEQLSEDVRRHLESLPVQARRDSLAYRTGKFVRRHAVGLAAGGLVVAALVAGIVATAHQARAANLEREKAVRINTFLETMLASADPVRDGREVTVAEVLDRAAQEIDRSLDGRPDIEAGVRTTLGRTYQALGLYAEAEPHLRRALALQRALHGERHPELAVSLRNLAELLQARGDHAGADSLYLRALAVQQRLLGAAHPELATTLSRLGQLREAQGEYTEAATLFERSLAMRRRLFGEAHGDVADGLNDLGLLRYAQGDYAAAESLSRSALELNRQLYGDEHNYVAANLNNLAMALDASGRYEEAEKVFEDVLAMRRRLLGDDHPELTWVAHNLATVLRNKGDYARAEPLYREVLARQRRDLGDEHPDLAYILHHLATVLHGQGRLEEADSLLRRAITLDRRFRHDPDPITAFHLAAWASLMGDLGRAAEAEATFARALADLHASAPEEHAYRVGAALRWGEFLVKQGRAAEAEAPLRQALAGSERLYGPEHVRTLASRIWLGRCLTTLGRHDQAEALLEPSYRAALDRQGAGSRISQQALDALIELYTEWNKPQQAATYRALRQNPVGEMVTR